MARARADVGEAEPLQQRSDMAFVIVDAEALLDDALEIEAPPAHDAVDLSVGASFDDRRQFGLLRRRQTRRRDVYKRQDYRCRDMAWMQSASNQAAR